ncbi:hypothetical protein L228DRAFT_261650 [Xylona heveae TC161]|uniref:Sister chromatid cohesion and DNA repair protein n=1 Tax=Xylona heveae (strain CBS 132557 / TC161) TaxID=1328760 RepID=A0A165FWT3_XYLHT|nr:hypothetical protein L228DRAFT_261650 [Xylona heveae TC161]KZF21480.1 hypothetical protein L228DRAFT_261650 [Xylona heveae TC161]
MPTRSRASAAAAAATTEETEAEPEIQESLGHLQFDEPLTWRAGKAIPVAELLRRLQALSKELRDMEQEEAERDSFTKVAKELATHNLLTHKDRGVRAWTACCVVDILRLCAPDAPYTGSQLRDIFTLIVTSILPALADPADPYNTQHMYVLQSLAQVKSIVLLTDIPSSDSLILHLFTSFFDIMSGSSKSSSGEELGKNVEYHMTAILVILVDEAGNLPAEVIDVIVAQFLRADPRAIAAGNNNGNGKNKKSAALAVQDDKQSTLLLKELPPAYTVARTLCNSCPEKMARYISHYFSDVIVDASAAPSGESNPKKPGRKRNDEQADSDEDEGPSGPTEEDLKELNKAHRLLRELWRASPPVLQNVIPQLEAELSTENVQLRLLATETLGDMVAGIGAAGPPQPPVMDPAIYPPPTLTTYSDASPSQSIMNVPSSPQPFSQTHPATYSNFLARQRDKSALIRAAWTTCIGWILATSSGGVGLSPQEEQTLVDCLARMLVDSDERVRIAAVKAVGVFGFRDVVLKLGSRGGVTDQNSVLCNIAERAKDRKPGVRVEAMTVLGRIWGVAAGEIAAGNASVADVLSGIPSKLFESFYVNDLEINALLDRVIFELLLPLSYPPIKAKGHKAVNGSSQRVKDSQPNESPEISDADPDKTRAERILILVKGLETRPRTAFFALQSRQVVMAKVMTIFLKRCEEYNGGVIDGNEAEIKSHMTRLIDYFAKTFPDSVKVTADLWKFAKMHDRRSYQLIRFCLAPESDYRTVYKAIREFSKRIESAPGASAALLETLVPLLYRVSLLVFNKSHVPFIMEYSRTDQRSLGGTAHELLKEISTTTPEVFRAHVKELCKVLQEQAPSAKRTNEPGAVDTLKACATFAAKFPGEMPKDRRFMQALLDFTLYGSPPHAAKHAVSITLAVSDRKEMYVRDLLQKCTKDFKYGSANFLAKLATLSQIVLIAPKEVEEEGDAIVDIAIDQILLRQGTTSTETEDKWDDEVTDELHAKMWALRILVNRLRSHPDQTTLKEVSQPVFRLLNTLITNQGELSKKKDTPPAHKSRLRLLAAQLFLKLCTNKAFDDLLSAEDFNRLALTAQDALFPVRQAFITKLRKYLGQNKLPYRFYSVVFLMAYEPNEEFREETVVWIRARAAILNQHKSTAMESVFARLISLLAHHPDFGKSDEDLCDFARYILFYLQQVASEENLSLIYHIAQRIKQSQDAIDESKSENLYYLSDLSQAVIKKYEELHGWNLQTWPGKLRMPGSLFKPLDSRDSAQNIATTNYLSEDLDELLDRLVRAAVRGKSKKRKSEAVDETTAKKRRAAVSTPSSKPKAQPASTRKNGTKTKSTPRRSQPKKPKHDSPPPSERRRSARAAAAHRKSYAESDGDEDEVMHEEDDDDQGEEEEEKELEEEDENESEEENGNESSPPGEGHDDDDDDGALSDPPDSD